jgi:predicted RNA-binding Zn ribbon-like protein
VPSAARWLLDFINTYEPQVDEETLVSPEALSAWLVEQGLLRPGVRLGATHLGTAITLREGLRATLMRRTDPDVVPDKVRSMEEVLSAIPVRLSLVEGAPHLVGIAHDPFDLAMAGLIEAMRRCAEDGSWTRLKVCDRDTCRWAYFDNSRNMARRWCSMAGCGNYVKMRRASAARRGRTGLLPRADQALSESIESN